MSEFNTRCREVAVEVTIDGTRVTSRTLVADEMPRRVDLHALRDLLSYVEADVWDYYERRYGVRR